MGENGNGDFLETTFGLAGKIALVTGSSRGLGLVFARGLARAGATIILNGRDRKRLEAAAASLKNDGYRVGHAAFDVTNADSIDAAVSEVESDFGSIDILVNNAGIQRRAPLEETTEENWRAVIDGNLTSAFLVSKRAVRGMIARKSGKIINICSLQSAHARKTIAPYAASKSGLRSLTQTMATEWGRYDIQANGVGPGYFKTEMTEPLYNDPDFDSWIRGRTPMDRWGDPEELVGLLVYLASPASSFTSGQVFYVDGGLLATI